MSLSVIIPMHSFHPAFNKCMKAIEEVAQIEDFELIIVLDGVRNDPTFFDQFQISSLKVIELEQNNGPAHARNEGAKYATGEILLFMDADVAIGIDTIKKVITHFSVPGASDALIGSYDNDPSDLSLVSKYRNLLHHFTHQQASEHASTFWGACGAIRKEVFTAVGGFNTCFSRPSVEDIEFGYRLIHQGFKIRLDKSLQVKHLKKWTFYAILKTDIMYRAKPWTQLLHSYRNWGIKDLNINWEERLVVAFLCMTCLCIIVGFVYPGLWLGSTFFMGLVLLFKRKVYSFFSRHYPNHQLPLVILLHWIYLLCAAIGLFLGTLEIYISFIHRKTGILSLLNANRKLEPYFLDDYKTID